MNVLSVLLPVYNAQGKLEADVTEILEVLSEAARRFELCILDDGSTDDTADVARLLAAGIRRFASFGIRCGWG